MASRDAEVRAVATELDALLASLRTTVDALTAVLLPPEADASKERIVT